MKLLEYQAKKVLKEMRLPVPVGQNVNSIEKLENAVQQLHLTTGVLKAQAYTGGRGKAGGIKLYKTLDEAKEMYQSISKMRLVTKQTGPEGTEVHSVYIEEANQIEKELYVAFVVDRSRGSIAIILSEEGGADIEEVTEKNPEKIFKLYPNFLEGVTESLAREGFDFMHLAESLFSSWFDCLQKLYKVFVSKDCSLLEINPLITTKEGELSILDCKFDVDDNALFRQSDLDGDPNADNTTSEIEATQYGLSYIQLDGKIGCMVNGAGLAMATMDIIQHYGGSPANFLDVGGSASKEAIVKAFQIITSDQNVEGILVNIFGGIMRCDVIAKGILKAMEIVELKIPLVVRLSGTKSEEGQEIIDKAGLDLVSAEALSEAAKKIVQIVYK